MVLNLLGVCGVLTVLRVHNFLDFALGAKCVLGVEGA